MVSFVMLMLTVPGLWAYSVLGELGWFSNAASSTFLRLFLFALCLCLWFVA